MEPKKFYIFKTKEKTNDKQPDYSIAVKKEDEHGEIKWDRIGICWKNVSKNGDTYLSCQENTPMENKTNDDF